MFLIYYHMLRLELVLSSDRLVCIYVFLAILNLKKIAVAKKNKSQKKKINSFNPLKCFIDIRPYYQTF